MNSGNYLSFFFIYSFSNLGVQTNGMPTEKPLTIQNTRKHLFRPAAMKDLFHPYWKMSLMMRFMNHQTLPDHPTLKIIVQEKNQGILIKLSKIILIKLSKIKVLMIFFFRYWNLNQQKKTCNNCLCLLTELWFAVV